MKKQSLTALILSVMILSSAFGCSNSRDTDVNTETEKSVSDENTSSSEMYSESESETENIYDDGLEKEDFGGYEFRINSRQKEMMHNNLLVEELTGEVLNDAFYQRQMNVAEKFNVVFSEQLHEDGSSFEARKSILANDDEYDLLSTRCTAVINFVGNGLVHDLEQLPYINLEKPYWYKDITREANIGDKIYYPLGDISMALLDTTNLLCFNKQMMADFDLGDVYELVRNKKWTMEKHLEMASAVVSDLNGDGTMDTNDRYGTVGTINEYAYSMLVAHNVKAVNKDSSNIPVFNAAKDEKFINAFAHTMDVIYSSNQWIDPKDGELMNLMFKGEQSLFLGVTFGELEVLRDMETDFGIIPYPMEDESVGRYYSRSRWFEALMVPITAANPARNSKIIEALAAESGRIVYPAYYDIALANKTTRDEESREMLDIIKESRIFDMGDNVWCDLIRDGFIYGLIDKKGDGFISKLEGKSLSISKQMEKTVNKFID